MSEQLITNIILLFISLALASPINRLVGCFPKDFALSPQPIKHRFTWILLTNICLVLLIYHYFPAPTQAWPAFIFSITLNTLTFIDLETHLLPDTLTQGLLWLGLLLSPWRFDPILAIWGAAAGYLSLAIIGKTYAYVRKQEGLGMGDCKLLAAFGAWFGPYPLPLIIFISAISGLLVGALRILLDKQTLNQPLAFGPYLAVSGLIVYFIGAEAMMNWIYSLSIL